MATTRETELLPCPFCGSNPRYQCNNRLDFRESVWCDKCDFGMFDPDDKSSVIDAWNTRAK